MAGTSGIDLRLQRFARAGRHCPHFIAHGTAHGVTRACMDRRPDRVSNSRTGMDDLLEDETLQDYSPICKEKYHNRGL